MAKPVASDDLVSARILFDVVGLLSCLHQRA
jgi:hypothetical protein